MNATGKTLKQLREEAGLTQEQLAFRMGVTRATIYNWETGAVQPSRQYIKPLADLLGVTTAAIYAAIDTTMQQS